MPNGTGPLQRTGGQLAVPNDDERGRRGALTDEPEEIHGGRVTTVLAGRRRGGTSWDAAHQIACTSPTCTDVGTFRPCLNFL